MPGPTAWMQWVPGRVVGPGSRGLACASHIFKYRESKGGGRKQPPFTTQVMMW